MATNTQFSIAVHLMIALGFDEGRHATSTHLATSINTSPSFVRRILAKLSKANLVSTTTGKSGFCLLAKKPEDISLLEIYKAVDAPATLRFTIIRCRAIAREQQYRSGDAESFEKSAEFV